MDGKSCDKCNSVDANLLICIIVPKAPLFENELVWVGR